MRWDDISKLETIFDISETYVSDLASPSQWQEFTGGGLNSLIPKEITIASGPHDETRLRRHTTCITVGWTEGDRTAVEPQSPDGIDEDGREYEAQEENWKMNTMLAILQGTTADFTWNYIILGVLVVLAVVLGLSVMKNRQQDI